MIDAREHDEIIDSFYAASTGVIPWTTALDRIALLFGSSATLLGIHRPDTLEVLTIRSHNYSDDFMSDFFFGDIYANDPRIPYIARAPAGSVYYDEMLYDVREMERDPWVRSSIEALGVFDQMGAKLRLPNDGVATLGLFRTEREGRVTTESVDAFARLVPQIERACALGYVVEREATTKTVLLQMLADRHDGLILLDRSASIIFMNESARQLLNAGDGLSWHQNSLLARRPPETRRLQQIIRRTIEGFGVPGSARGGRMLVTRPSGRKPYIVTIIPAPPREAFLTGTSAACVIHLQDLGAPALPTPACLAEVFGLTMRESDLAVELVRTARLGLAATRCGMALNTARNHLQNIFSKSGTCSQTEAVQLFSRLL